MKKAVKSLRTFPKRKRYEYISAQEHLYQQKGRIRFKQTYKGFL